MPETMTRLPGGWSLVAQDEVTSTMHAARDHLRDGPDAVPFCVQAQMQTGGYGREGRLWQSPKGNLHLTFACPLPVPLAEAPLLSPCVALALIQALEDCCGRAMRPLLKWPNDVLLPGGKVAGILLETVPREGGRPAWVLIGVGVNLFPPPNPEAIPYPAASLRAWGCSADPATLRDALAAALSRTLQLPLRCGWAAVLSRWLACASGQEEGQQSALKAFSGVSRVES